MDKETLFQRMKEIAGVDMTDSQQSNGDWKAVVDRLLYLLEEKNEEVKFYKAACDAVPNPIFIKDEKLRFLFFNRAYREFFGLEEGENIGKQVQELSYLSEEEKARYHAEDSRMLEELSVISYDAEYETANQGKVEALYWSRGFRVPGSEQRGLVGEIVNISKEKQTQRELAKNMKAMEVLMRDTKTASNIDPLTKLYNRNIMEEELPTIIQSAQLMGQPVCLMLIDIDFFKQVNDVHGHGVGDEVLQTFGKVIRETFRQKDVAVRYGGDEFLLLMPGTRLEQAEIGAERLRESTRRQCILPDGKHVTLSIGISQYEADDIIEEFIAKSDAALYQSKKNGRDQISVREMG